MEKVTDKNGHLAVLTGNGFPLSRKEETVKDEEISELLRKESTEFRKLDEEHRNLKQTLAEIDKKVYLNADEEMERKKIQKLKLSKKDRMAELIREYKKSHSN
jgi:uncharacterized protein YdcH (DUF465 family)